MRCSATTLVAALSITGALAGPTRRHAHHQHAHEKKDVDYSKIDYSKLNIDWENLDVDWKSAYSAGLAQAKATPTPVATPSVVAVASVPTTTPADIKDKVNDVVQGVVAKLWNNLKGAANDITQFGAEVSASGALGDFYRGNCGNPWGHNMMKVSSREGQRFTNKFINTSKKDITVVIWNKIGPDGQVLSGSALAPVSPALTFALSPGQEQIVAFQENSQVAWAEACDEKTASGAFSTSWGEANFVTSGSGYDLSAILNGKGNNYNMSLSSTEVSCISDMTQNFWVAEFTPVGDSDGSCYIPQSTVTLTTLMGGVV